MSERWCSQITNTLMCSLIVQDWPVTH